MASTGVVVVKLWSKLRQQWRLVILDDYLPFYKDSLFFSSQSDNNEFWVALLEKALAKQIGSYHGLNGDNMIHISEAGEMILGPSKFTNKILIPENDDNLKVFNLILSFHKNGAIIVLTSADFGQFISTKNCLVNHHGYGLLEIKENIAGTNFTLIKVHNTWSRNDLGGEGNFNF